MKNINIQKKDLFSLLIVLFLGFIFIVFGLGIVGNLPQKYTEYIIETIASSGSNKSAELNLFWILLFGGIILLAIINKVIKKENNVNIEETAKNSLVSAKTTILTHRAA